MVKSEWTLDEVVNTLEMYKDTMKKGIAPPDDIISLIVYIEKLFCDTYMAEIRDKRSKIKNMWTDATGFLSFWFDQDRLVGQELSDIIAPGCYSCLFHKVNHVRHSSKCSHNCEFCYYSGGTDPDIGKDRYMFSNSDEQFTLDEAKMLVHRQGAQYGAIGWLQKEPLEEIEAIEPIMTQFAKMGMHQYLYTNGAKATPDVIDLLADWGLNEIRFNLAASKFNPKVIGRMQYACEKIKYVLIESPVYSESYMKFMEQGDELSRLGIHQMNLAELQVHNPYILDKVVFAEGPVYKHRRGYISPISSRQYTYKIIEKAEREMWPIVINDCSNDTKFFRGSYGRGIYPLGRIDYWSEFELPLEHTIYIAKEVLEPGVTYEFF